MPPLSPPQERAALALFDAAFDQAPDARSAWLVARCDGDSALLARVQGRGSPKAAIHLDPPPQTTKATRLVEQADPGAYRLELRFERRGMQLERRSDFTVLPA